MALSSGVWKPSEECLQPLSLCIKMVWCASNLVLKNNALERTIYHITRTIKRVLQLQRTKSRGIQEHPASPRSVCFFVFFWWVFGLWIVSPPVWILLNNGSWWVWCKQLSEKPLDNSLVSRGAGMKAILSKKNMLLILLDESPFQPWRKSGKSVHIRGVQPWVSYHIRELVQL